MDHSQRKIAKQFFSLFKVESLDATSFMLTSSKEKMLVRTHLIHPEDIDTSEEVINLMDLHLSFDHQYIAPLLHFQKCSEGVRAFYTIDQTTLKVQVQTRRKEERYFSEEQLWVLLSSVVDSLLYLQNKGLIYGVLSSSKIFVSDQIRLMDPSAFNLAPVDISRISYHSPQIASVESDIDFNQSDVYLLGLCMVEAASLVSIDNKVTKEVLDIILRQVEGRYSNQLMHVLTHLLKEFCQERPSFSDIKQYIASQIQIQGTKIWPAEALAFDSEDFPSELGIDCTSDTRQEFDYLQPNHEQNRRKRKSQYERARGRFLQSPPLKDIQNLLQTHHRTREVRDTAKSTFIHEEKMNRKTEESHLTSQIGEFKLKGSDTVHKRKKPRAVEIKNRNAEEVRRIESFRYQQTYTDPSIMTILKQETDRAKEYLKASNCR